MKRGDEVKAVMLALRKGDTSSLNATELKLLHIIHMTDNLIMTHGTGRNASKMVKEAISTAYGMQVSITDAQYYIRIAQSVLGSRLVFNKHYYRGFLMERLIPALNILERECFPEVEEIYEEEYVTENGTIRTREAKRKVVKAGDPKLIKEYNAMIGQIRELLQLDKEDKPEDEVPAKVVITTDVKTIGITQSMDLSDELIKRLEEYGAKRDKNGSWQ